MPIDSTPSVGGSGWTLSFAGPASLITFSVNITTNDTEANSDATVQSLVNHISEWPGVSDIHAQKYNSNSYAITPDE